MKTIQLLLPKIGLLLFCACFIVCTITVANPGSVSEKKTAYTEQSLNVSNAVDVKNQLPDCPDIGNYVSQNFNPGTICSIAQDGVNTMVINEKSKVKTAAAQDDHPNFSQVMEVKGLLYAAVIKVKGNQQDDHPGFQSCGIQIENLLCGAVSDGNCSQDDHPTSANMLNLTLVQKNSFATVPVAKVQSSC